MEWCSDRDGVASTRNDDTARRIHDAPSRRHVFAMRTHARTLLEEFLPAAPRRCGYGRTKYALIFLPRFIPRPSTVKRSSEIHQKSSIPRARRICATNSDRKWAETHVRITRRRHFVCVVATARVSLWYVAWAVYQRGPRWRRLLPARWKTLREAGISAASVIGRQVRKIFAFHAANTGVFGESVMVVEIGFRKESSFKYSNCKYPISWNLPATFYHVVFKGDRTELQFAAFFIFYPNFVKSFELLIDKGMQNVR